MQSNSSRKNSSQLKSASKRVKARLFAVAAATFSTTTLAAQSPVYINATAVRNVEALDMIPSGPGLFKKQVKMKILLGGNPCTARGMVPLVEARYDNGNLNLHPVTIRTMASTPEICTTEWNPVYAPYSVEFAGEKGQYEEILLHNVEDKSEGRTTLNLN